MSGCASPIVIVKNKQVATLAEMNRLALKLLFDKFHMTRDEQVLLEESIEQWPRKANLQPEEKKIVGIILDALIFNESGGFDKMKEEMIRHGLDYRKVFANVLEART